MLEVDAIADSEVTLTRIPKSLADRLHLDPLETRIITDAEGLSHTCSYVGLQVKFENRHSLTGALVFGDELILGSTTMLDLDVVIAPDSRKLIVKPASPNIAHGFVFTFFPKAA